MKLINITGTKKQAKIDDCDFDSISLWKWNLSGSIYPYRKETYEPKKVRKLYMHQQIMGRNGELHIDHINHDPLDNQRVNLRFVTRSQNMQNMLKKKPNKLGLKGVTKATNGNGYYARIRLNRKEINLGYYLDPLKAHEAYKQASLKYHKEYGSI